MHRPLWVFGYGSLMWNPEFDYLRCDVARLDGYRRGFTMASIHHRGTEADPGLVLALDETPGAACEGLAFEVPGDTAEETLAVLRERELVSSAYVERWEPVHLRGGGTVTALAYVIERSHPQYRGDQDLETQARIIASARGGRGPNSEYLFNTARNLSDLDIADPDLDWLCGRVSQLIDPGGQN
ncbi:MAG: gamma-glutamylcyclotransferase [Pseudomonadota bacterium]